jgi:predicted trehalose synthase
MTAVSDPIFDALGDDPSAALAAIGEARRITAGGAEVVGVPAASFEGLRGDPAEALPPKRLAGEMTNRAWRLGDRFFLKLYSRLTPGPHPELEMLGELTGYKVVPPLAGWLECAVPGDDPAIAGILLGWIPDAANAWDLAVTDPERIRGLVRRLGRRIAEMHLALEDADGPSFSREPLDAAYLAGLHARMMRLAEEVLAGTGGEAGDLLPAAQERFGRLLRLSPGGARMRVHGDLHLGQVLLFGIDFLVIDFEGEPDRPLAERREKHSPLVDAAGMIRSFEYVADREGSAWATEEWRARMEQGFLDAYLETAGVGSFLPPRETTTELLRAFRLERAIYELRYELSHRPDWARIPLAGIRRILFREG